MKTYDVQSIDLSVPRGKAFELIADPAQLPAWTGAFASVAAGRETRRAAALYRSYANAPPPDAWWSWLTNVVGDR